MSHTYNILSKAHVRYILTLLILSSLLFHIPALAHAEHETMASATMDSPSST